MKVADLAGRELDVAGVHVTLAVRPHKHVQGALIVAAVKDDGADLGTLSVSVWGTTLGEEELLAKTSPQNQAIIAAARATGWFEPTGETVNLGFCLAEVWRVLG